MTAPQVLSLESDAAKAHAHAARTAARGLWNNVVCAGAADAGVAVKLSESPEMIRYQVVSLSFAPIA